jgi:serine protease Do
LLALPALLAACSFSATTANIRDAKLSRDEAGKEVTNTFAQADTFYLTAQLRNAPDDTTVRAVWTAVEADEVESNTKLDEKELETGSGHLTFNLQNDQLWPVGKYKVDLYVDDKLVQTLEFAVAGDVAARPSGGVSSLDEVKSATVQIEAQGSFVDPAEGLQLNVAGRGSGFIIDPSGIAVTNNHVVTGAALLKVWVGGESEDEARNAKILGASECSDLAVIDIDGDGFPFLNWYEGDAKTGLDVYAAGFPLGEPEFTLTKGIISKELTSGETEWASVDRVHMHDATINPGNSGGPLVTEGGQVVSVNYAGSSDTDQYFSIARDEALEVIEQLRRGQDITSIGVNGSAVNDGEGLSGIWVASVKSGSPADAAGILAGDIITKIEGLALATDGSMADYCDILRTHDPEDVLSVEVLRFETHEVLEGQLNGRQLEQSVSFAEELQGQVSGDASETYADYEAISDDSEAVQMEVPAEWADRRSGGWPGDGFEGVSITASSDVDEFLSGYSTPGVFFAASREAAESYEPAGLLDAMRDDIGVGQCTRGERADYEDPFYKGKYDLYTSCGGSQARIIVVAAVPDDRAFITLVLVQASAAADLDALDRILDTFQVTGDLP